MNLMLTHDGVKTTGSYRASQEDDREKRLCYLTVASINAPKSRVFDSLSACE